MMDGYIRKDLRLCLQYFARYVDWITDVLVSAALPVLVHLSFPAFAIVFMR